MKCKGTKRAGAKTSSVACYAELDFRDGGHTSVFFIYRMIRIHIRQGIYIIHLNLCEGFGCRILNHINPLVIRLYKSFTCKWVRIHILYIKTSCIIKLVSLKVFIRRQHLIIIHIFNFFCLIYSPINKCNVFYIKSRIKCFRYFNNGMFSHSIRNNISL